MRFHSIFRIREHVRVLVQKVRRVTVFLLVLGVLFSSLVVGKNVFLGEVRKEIRKSFAYDSLKPSYFPPALVLENVRSLAGPPTFRARRVRVEVPYLSLLRNRKAISVALDSMEVRLAPAAPGAPRPKVRGPRSAFSLPFIIERGLVENGSVIYETAKGTLEVRGLRALVTQSGEEFTVRATAARSGYSSRVQSLEFGGALSVSLSGRGEAVKVDRLTVEGPDVAFSASGSFQNFLTPEFDLDVRFDIETAYLDAVL
ncbi:MAG: hypothetical protein Q8N53_18860, partial [Longimicrobiales bacterium]|nr:hypothetical protein [Longimicrobiales bacterium]